MPLLVRINDNDVLLYEGQLQGPLEFGRQQQGEQGPGSVSSAAGVTRIVMASLDNKKVARRQLQAIRTGSSSVRLTNISTSVDVRVEQGVSLESGGTGEFPLPVTLQFASGHTVSLSLPPLVSKEDSGLESLGNISMAPGQMLDFSDEFARPLQIEDAASDSGLGHILRVLQETMEVFRNARNAEGLYTAAVNGAVRVVGFDSARVLLYINDQWVPVRELHSEGRPCSTFVLQEVLQHCRTFWTSGTFRPTVSVARLDAVIASPIVSREGKVVGVLYGERVPESQLSMATDISRMDAYLMELLAFALAAELDRQQQEAESQRNQTLFAQFFSASLAQHLKDNPDLLAGQEVEVSVIFCDVRRFSAISEVVDAQTIFAFINDVIGAISECIDAEGGVIVDYVGDAVMGMFGAPQVQPDHSVRAARAAQAMLGRRAALTAKWRPVIGEDVDFSIGINSGKARAGNSGSAYRFKYGPLGREVNLASRIQGVTKQLQARILLSRAAEKNLGPEFVRRRLCRVRVVNMLEPVELFELNDAGSRELNQRYEQALLLFEQGDLKKAARQLGEILEAWPDDGPTLVLLSRVVNAMLEGAEHLDTVWNLSRK